MPPKKPTISIPIHSLARTLHYKNACLRQLWLESHFVMKDIHDEAEEPAQDPIRFDPTLDAIGLALVHGPSPRRKQRRLDHDAAVKLRAQNLESQGYTVHCEIDVVFGSTPLVAGRIDILAYNSHQCLIEEVKTSDYGGYASEQVGLYLYAVEKGGISDQDIRAKVDGKQFVIGYITGSSKYRHVPGPLTPGQIGELKKYVDQAVAPELPVANDSGKNCNFCDADESLCPDRRRQSGR